MNQTRPQFATANAQTYRVGGLLGHILGVVIFLAIVALVILFVVPLGILLLVVGLIAYGIYRIKRAFRRAHEPNGPLDGRRNVRVVQRDE